MQGRRQKSQPSSSSSFRQNFSKSELSYTESQGGEKFVQSWITCCVSSPAAAPPTPSFSRPLLPPQKAVSCSIFITINLTRPGPKPLSQIVAVGAAGSANNRWQETLHRGLASFSVGGRLWMEINRCHMRPRGAFLSLTKPKNTARPCPKIFSRLGRNFHFWLVKFTSLQLVFCNFLVIRLFISCRNVSILARNGLWDDKRHLCKWVFGRRLPPFSFFPHATCNFSQGLQAPLISSGCVRYWW